MDDILIAGVAINPLEAFASALGIVAVFFQVKQKLAFWPLWIITALIYIYIFFISKLYALMSLQFYYVAISVYGWYNWIKGKAEDDDKIKLLTGKQWVYILFALLVLTVVFYMFLDRFTDSVVPFWDGFATALCFVASWMLSHKYLQHWLMWIVADVVSTGVYFSQELYPTTVFFFVLTFMAVIGYFQWKKQVAAELSE